MRFTTHRIDVGPCLSIGWSKGDPCDGDVHAVLDVEMFTAKDAVTDPRSTFTLSSTLELATLIVRSKRL